MKRTILLGPTLVNEGAMVSGTVVLEDEYIAAVLPGVCCASDPLLDLRADDEVIDCANLWLLPGIIDDQVHFREPGLTHKATIESETRAAVAGGVTSFMDMPNTNPPTTDLEQLMWKRERASQTAWCNYSFFVGGTNENMDQVCDIDPTLTPGIKLFLGSSTGNMLVDREEALDAFFAHSPLLIATHCESEDIIKRNKEYYKGLLPSEQLDVHYHSLIRSHEACFLSSQSAVRRAEKYGTRLHILHLSTAQETELFEKDKPLPEKRITGEVCVHHLWFNDEDYDRLGNRIKWNPSIKKEADRKALQRALVEGRIDVVATDHAPHLLSEKEGNCLRAASGGPLLQYSLLAMLTLAMHENLGDASWVVQKMAHNPAILFGVYKRGFVRTGYYADLVLVDPKKPQRALDASVLSLCGWTPFDGVEFACSIHSTWVNGALVYKEGVLLERPAVHPIIFNKR